MENFTGTEDEFTEYCDGLSNYALEQLIIAERRALCGGDYQIARMVARSRG